MKTVIASLISRFLSRPSALHLAGGPFPAAPVAFADSQQPGPRHNRRSRDVTEYAVGMELRGVVTGIAHYGIFVRLPNGESGLVFQGEICWPGEAITYGIGARVNVLVMAFKPGRGLALSIRETRVKAAFTSFCDANDVGSTVVGQIKSLVDYGVFITLAPGVAGLLHISAIPDIRAYTKESIGQAITVRLVDIARDTRRISLELA